MATQSHITIACILTAILWPSVSATCYFRSSHTVIQADDWNTCTNSSDSLDQGAKLCCKNAFKDAVCGDSSLCRQSDGLFYAGGCTDSTYQDPICRSSCTGFESQYVIWNTSQALWHCCGDSWCNYNNETVSEETFNGVGAHAWKAMSNETAVKSTATASTAAPSTTVSSSPAATTNAASAESTAQDPDSSGLSDAAAVGIGVGAGVGAIAVLILAVWLVMRARKRKLAVKELHCVMPSQPASPFESQCKYDSSFYSPHEVPGNSEMFVRELDAAQRGVEMPCR